MRDLKWSNAEKAIARKAFNKAYDQEMATVIHKAKQMASNIEEPDQLWELESYLAKTRKAIDEKYDYRYSVLPSVFARFIGEGLLSEEDLEGLGDDKLGFIRAYLALT